MLKRSSNIKTEDVQQKEKEESKPLVEEAEPTPSTTEATLPIWKFFSLYMPDVEKYIQAYLGGRFRGQLMTESEWRAEIKKHIKEM